MAVIGNLVVGMSADVAPLTKDIKKAEQVLSSWGLSGVSRQLTAFGSATTAAGLAVAGLSAASGALKAGLKASVGEAISMEKAIAGLSKASDLEGDALGKMKQGLFDLSTELRGVSIDSILEIATSGAKLGIAADDLLEYTGGVAKLTTAMDDLPAETIAEQIGSINNVFKLGVRGALQLGSAIDKLADSGISSSAGILDVTQRISGAAAAMKLTAAETVALSAALLDTGTKAEAGAGSLTMLLQAMVRTENHADFAKVIGTNVEQLSETIRTKPMEAIRQFLDAMSKLDAPGQLEALDSVGITADRGSINIQKLSQVVDKLNDYVTAAEREFATLNQIQQSYNKTANLTDSAITQTTNSLRILGSTIGEEFLPEINEALGFVNELAKAFVALKKDAKIDLGSLVGASGLGFIGQMADLAGHNIKSVLDLEKPAPAPAPKAAPAAGAPAKGGKGKGGGNVGEEAVFGALADKKDKTAKAIKSLNDDLKEQIAVLGVDGHMADVLKLKLQGATDGQLEHVAALAKQLDQAEKAKKLQDLNNELLEQSLIFGKTPGQIAGYRAALAGANAEQQKMAADMADSNDRMERARSIIEETQSPLDAYNKRLKELNELRAGGNLTDTQFKRASDLAKGEFESASQPGNRFAGALEKGSQGARDILANFRGVDRQGDPNKEVAKNTGKSVEYLGKIAGNLERYLTAGESSAIVQPQQVSLLP